MQREFQPVGLFGADGVHVEQRRLHHRLQCLLGQSDPWHLPRRAGMRLGNRQRILFGDSRRLLGQHHQRRLRGGRLFVVRRCCVHGYRSSVHGLHTLRRVRGGERVLVGTGQPELLGHADSLQSALCGRLRQPNRLYRQHAVAEGCGRRRRWVARLESSSGAQEAAVASLPDSRRSFCESKGRLLGNEC